MQTLPTGWKVFSQTQDSLTVLRPGHTTTAPRIAIFDRRVATQNGNGFSVPTYRVRLISGGVDDEGAPIRERSLVEVNIRSPLGISPTVTTEAIAAVALIIGDAEFADDATVDQMFPREE